MGRVLVDVGAVAEQNVAAAGQSPAHRGCWPCHRGRAGGGQACVGVDDDLHVGGQPVGGFRGADLAVTDRDQRAVHDPQPVGRIDGT